MTHRPAAAHRPAACQFVVAVVANWVAAQQRPTGRAQARAGKSGGTKCSIRAGSRYQEQPSSVVADLIWKGKNNNEYAIDKNTKKIIIKKNTDYYRPSDVSSLKGNPNKAKKYLGWYPKTKFKDLVKIMVDADRKRSLIGRIIQ